MVTKSQYRREKTDAARTVFLESLPILEPVLNQVIIIGGLAPGLLLPDAPEKHIGTIDIDFVLKPMKTMRSKRYNLKRKFLDGGFTLDHKEPFSFLRKSAFLKNHKVQVHFLTGENPRSPRSESQNILGIDARSIPGLELACENPVRIGIANPLKPEVEYEVQVVNLPTFMILKGLAMRMRVNNKDLYDLYYCLKNFSGGDDALLEELELIDLGNKKVIESIRQMTRLFSSPEDDGPTGIADFLEITDKEERAIIQRDAFEKVQDLIRRLGIK